MKYTLKRQESILGEFTLEELRTLQANGELNSLDQIFKEGWNDWAPAMQLEGILGAKKVQGSGSSNTLPAFLSLLFPGLGQLIQGRVLLGIIYLVLSLFFSFLILLTDFRELMFGIPLIIICIYASHEAYKYQK